MKGQNITIPWGLEASLLCLRFCFFKLCFQLIHYLGGGGKKGNFDEKYWRKYTSHEPKYETSNNKRKTDPPPPYPDFEALTPPYPDFEAFFANIGGDVIHRQDTLVLAEGPKRTVRLKLGGRDVDDRDGNDDDDVGDDGDDDEGNDVEGDGNVDDDNDDDGDFERT